MNPTFADAATASPPTLLGAYRPPASVYDEAVDADGRVRPDWSEFVGRIEALGADALKERREGALQLLRDHGVSYNVVDDGWNAERPWKLDVLPMIIGSAEWARLEAGLIQRTQLMNLVLGDLYGPQRLLRDGLLPPAFLYANPGFIRQCHGIKPPGGNYLSLHAVDLTRAPNGQWWVLADRTQAPSGVGYALENRIILSRTMPDEFHGMNVHRIASFFLQRRAGLRAMAPWTDEPNIVWLTPGPYTATYFEHAYLARYLGYPLVEGSDLTVRDRKVFIKTIDGLQRVDVIVRRVDDTYCDPLELRSDSFLGVPGLMEAARAGNVAISNALGSGAVEAPALLAFLPALAERLLGEELRIPNVATWWCGQRRERDFTFSNLRSLVIKKAFVRGRGEPVFCEKLDPNALKSLSEQIRSHPHDFVGQEHVAVSTAPVWNGESLVPHPLILRCFIAATPNGFTVMPGGLTRISAQPDTIMVTSKHGGGNKDTWVLAETPVEEVTLLDKSGRPLDSHRHTATVPSRVVDNLFWLGRYAERLEDHIRVLRPVLSRLAGEGGAAEAEELSAMVRCLVALERLPARYGERIARQMLAEAIRVLIFGKEDAGSIRQIISRVGYLTASLRDRFSGDTWRILRQMTVEFPATPIHFTPGAGLAILHRLIFLLAAFSGMEMENMTRGHAWRFLEIGRRVERASNLAAMLRAAVTMGGADALVPVLEYSDSTMTYRRRYFARPDWPSTLDLLLGDASNPRSFAFQLNAMGRHLIELPDPADNRPLRRKFAEMEAALHAADFAALGAAVTAGDVVGADRLLGSLTSGCWSVSDALTVHYFSHSQARIS